MIGAKAMSSEHISQGGHKQADLRVQFMEKGHGASLKDVGIFNSHIWMV